MSEPSNLSMSTSQAENQAVASPDMTSLLNQVKTQQEQLQSYKAAMEELEKVNEKLSAQKREEMKEQFQKQIQKWVEAWPTTDFNNEYKQEILEKAQNMANKGVENGVWKLLCCASNMHKNQVNEIQRLTEDYNTLKGKVEGGEFRHEESRKRKEPDSSAPDTWAQLESMCKNY